MKKINLSLIAIFVAIFLPLLTVSATSAWAATYYVDAVNGNDATGAADNSNLPFKTVAKINTFFQSGKIVPGDYIKFKKGATPTEQIFRDNCISLYNCSGSSGAPITITSYGTGSYKPVIIATKTITKNSGIGWTGPDGNGVYKYTSSTTYGQNLFEDDIPLYQAASSAVQTGQFFWSGSTLYYKPTSGTPANHLITGHYWGYGVECQYTVNNYITLDGLVFKGAGIYNKTNAGSMHDWIIQNCDFLYKSVSFWHSPSNTYYWSDVTIQNCTFDYCESASISCELADMGSTYLRLNILNNKITHNNMLPSGNLGHIPFPMRIVLPFRILKILISLVMI